MSKKQWSGKAPETGEVIAESRGFRLYRVRESGEWQNLKLIAKTMQAKANYELAWNGDRLAMGKDAVLLNTHHPDVFDWVVDQMAMACQ